MGRNKIKIEKEELVQALRELPTQQDVAERFGCSQGTISNKIREYGIGPRLIAKTEKQKSKEIPTFSYEEAKKNLSELEEETEEKIGYNEVEVEIETDRPIMIIPVGDTHIGARYVYYRRMFRTVDDICEDPYKFTIMTGDYADNYNTSAYKAGQIDQQLPIQVQKGYVESVVKRLSQNTLGIVQGCHDEWSYFNDGFDFAQYLSSKSMGYYMGHNGLIHLTVGDVLYDIYVTHNTYRNSILNPGHGLACVFKDIVDCDIAIGGHIHRPHFEQRVVRGKLRTISIVGSVKGEDRHASKSGFPPLLGCTPGFILNNKKKEVLGNINYKTLEKFI